MRRTRGFPRRIGPRKHATGRRARLHSAGQARCQRRPACDVFGVQQTLHRHADEARVADVAIAVRVHQPLQLGERGPGRRAGLALQNIRRSLGHGQQLQHGHAAGRRRRHADHVDPIGSAKGSPLDRPVCGDVRDRQRAGTWLFGDRGGDLTRDAAPVEGVHPAAGDLGHRFCVGRVAQHVAGDEALAVRPGEIGVGPTGPRLSPGRRDHPGQTRTDHEPVARQPLGIPKQ